MDQKNGKLKILFICMGNICRSPMAVAVMRRRLAESEDGERIYVEAAGTHGDYHAGEPADPRARRAGAGRGYSLEGLVARKVRAEDFVTFDLILAMDHHNLAHLRRLCPEEYQHKLGLLLEYSQRWTGKDVPDPYYGGPEGFERVLDMIEEATEGLLAALRNGGQASLEE
ncbi:low molecular weight protein-tyrosine-phosphatase [Pelomicrobium sp. G1]|uniref:low molecular weight protein-tyrosine-phosphatase n=1 Tax=unclassified Pelomicrobium TaxID=2815318 RepID=UPI003F7610C9